MNRYKSAIRRSVCALGYVGIVCSLPVMAQEADWSAVNTTLVHQHVMPRYAAMAESSAHLQQSLEAFCQVPTEPNLVLAQTAYRQAMSDWQAVQHIGFGPVTLYMRNYALQYWPDKRNTTPNHLRSALADPETVFDDAFFSRVGISLKGFPVIERVLFTEEGVSAFQEPRPECRFIQGVSLLVANTADEISSEWEAFSQVLLQPGEGTHYRTADEVATLFMKSWVEPVQVILEQKILAPLGDSFDKARWQRSESWRSQQSIENLRVNMKALHHFFSLTGPSSVKDLLIQQDQKALAEGIDDAFESIVMNLDALPEVQETHVSLEQFEALSKIADELAALQELQGKAMQVLGIRLGFNSRDGD
ncbi:imelysin family protein [Nitrincola alkalisediminis]|uniref:imelysin family protein n=1 Tax=Nitrincola alkalisediminis TaxID=1366656 RepID=UPI0018734930|nr:imelysin family protein [Nitrincola alkalisediminis]